MLPYRWRFSIGVCRIALGMACLALYVASARTLISVALAAPIFAYVLYAFYMLKRSMETDGAPMVALIVDTVAFILWFAGTAAAGFGGTLWLTLNVMLYVFILVSAVLTQDWQKVAGVAGACLAAIFWVTWTADGVLQPVAFWLAVLAAVWVIHRRYLESRLARASRHSVMYRFEAQQAREDERQRMAADFHDGPLQSFIGLQMRLEIIRKLLERNSGQATEELRQVQDLVKSQVSELRTFVRNMRPGEMEGASLGASISRMVEQFQKETGIAASFLTSEYLEPAETQISLEVLQIVREALNNVQKHSNATRVSVSIEKHGEHLEIGVEDNGGGFTSFAGSYSLDELERLRLGPVSIRRRVRALGGDMQVDSKPGQGAGLRVRVSMS
jgi:signal transduction histidine kinase